MCLLPEEFDKISLDRSFAIYKQIYENAYGMHFTFVGKLDGENIKPLLEKYLGSLPAKEKEISYKDNGVRLVQGAKNN